MSAGNSRSSEPQVQGHSAGNWDQPYGRPFGEERSPGEAAMEFVQQYSRERPEVVAMWAFGIGFLLGWKLKPW